MPFEERGALSDEYLHTIKALWTREQPKFHGRYVRFEDIIFEPKPLQKPHIPLWIGGNSKAAIRRAVALGDAWHPTRATVEDIRAGAAYMREVCSEQGRDPDSMMIAVRLPLKFYDGQEAAVNRRPLLGGTQKIIDDIRLYRDAGVQYILLDSFYSASELQGETAESVVATMERFGAEVMPKFSLTQVTR